MRADAGRSHDAEGESVFVARAVAAEPLRPKHAVVAVHGGHPGGPERAQRLDLSTEGVAVVACGFPALEGPAAADQRHAARCVQARFMVGVARRVASVRERGAGHGERRRVTCCGAPRRVVHSSRRHDHCVEPVRAKQRILTGVGGREGVRVGDLVANTTAREVCPARDVAGVEPPHRVMGRVGDAVTTARTDTAGAVSGALEQAQNLANVRRIRPAVSNFV
mmetsp:Transcript_135410/g.329157  ORF Transcript_135410/g.329157 Transcript_135410/m.329157 type:complete len:222 (-) Transcript_135410:180-845(-)